MATRQAISNHGMGASLDFSKSRGPARYKKHLTISPKALQTLVNGTPLFKLAVPRKTQ
jgi:hypothetical protein